MGVEIDFLAVGEESSGGDAIALRYGNLHGPRSQQMVIVVDGGYSASGQDLVDHISKHYGTDYVDVVVSTHPDQDHSSGLKVVLEQLNVGELWMHQPWNHSGEMAQLRKSAFNSPKLSERVEASLRTTSDLEQVAHARGVPIVEPFAGLQTPDGGFRVLGPSAEYYESLIDEIVEGQSLLHKAVAGVEQLAKKVKGWITETLTDESLTDEGVVSPRNNSSVISLVDAGDRLMLLTGDAGIPALEQAADRLQELGVMPGHLNFVQVPHHGSQRNVGPSVLNRLLGEKGQEARPHTAFVSAPKKNPDGKHPSDKVTNAFYRRGYNVHGTQGTSKWHHHDSPQRATYSASTPIEFKSQVPED